MPGGDRQPSAVPPATPIPCSDGATYSVASFHTHTKRIPRRGEAARLVRPIGPSGQDNSIDTTDAFRASSTISWNRLAGAAHRWDIRRRPRRCIIREGKTAGPMRRSGTMNTQKKRSSVIYANWRATVVAATTACVGTNSPGSRAEPAPASTGSR